MKNNYLFFVLILFLCACHHINEIKYEKIYFQNLKKDLEDQIQIDTKKQEDLKEPQKRDASETIYQNVTLMSKTELQKTNKKKRDIKIGKLTIESNSMTFNKKTSVAVFLDNVKLRAQGVSLFCEKLQAVNYRENAEATGNVRINYPQQKVKITCNKVKYNNSMSKIEAYENVIAKKLLHNNEKINLFADKIEYDVETGEIIATKVSKKVKIKLKDIVAFSDKVIYNEITEEIELTGNPVVKKQESVFISSTIIIDVNKTIIKLKENIWSKLFYTDFEDIKREVNIEKNNN